MPNQILIEGAGLPGQPNSYYSKETTLSALAATGSPLVDTQTQITDAGWLMFEALNAAVDVVLEVPTSPLSFVTIIAGATTGIAWSDGTNLYLNNSSGSPVDVKYFILAHKP